MPCLGALTCVWCRGPKNSAEMNPPQKTKVCATISVSRIGHCNLSAFGLSSQHLSCTFGTLLAMVLLVQALDYRSTTVVQTLVP